MYFSSRFNRPTLLCASPAPRFSADVFGVLPCAPVRRCPVLFPHAAVAVSEKHRTPDGRFVEIRNVWAHNLEREMVVIREIVERYPYVAMVS